MGKLLTLTVIALSTLGCTTVQYNGSPIQYEDINIPEVGVVVTASIGDELLTKAKVATENVLVVREAINRSYYTIPAMSYVQIGYDLDQEFYSSQGVTRGFGGIPSALSVPIKTSEDSKICVINLIGEKTCYEGSYSKKSRLSKDGDNFQQTLIYSGRIGNKINIGYREFNNNLARPAFNNDVEYDLSNSKTISYKGSQIEILEAGNNSIKYKVISTFR